MTARGAGQSKIGHLHVNIHCSIIEFAWNADVRKALGHCISLSFGAENRRSAIGIRYDAAQCRQDLVALYPALRNVSFVTHEFIWSKS